MGLSVVAVPVQGNWLPVDVSRSEFVSYGYPYFTSSDCTGQIFGDPGRGPLPATVISPKDGIVYFENGPSQSIVVQSFLDFSGYCWV